MGSIARRRALLKRAVLIAASLLCSTLFFGMGSSMLIGEGTPPIWWGFGVTTLAYGAASVVLVCAAWRRRSAVLERTARSLALGYLLLFALASFDAGSLSGLEVVGLVVVAAALAVNWLVVRSLVATGEGG